MTENRYLLIVGAGLGAAPFAGLWLGGAIPTLVGLPSTILVLVTLFTLALGDLIVIPTPDDIPKETKYDRTRMPHRRVPSRAAHVHHRADMDGWARP